MKENWRKLCILKSKAYDRVQTKTWQLWALLWIWYRFELEIWCKPQEDRSYCRLKLKWFSGISETQNFWESQTSSISLLSYCTFIFFSLSHLRPSVVPWRVLAEQGLSGLILRIIQICKMSLIHAFGKGKNLFSNVTNAGKSSILLFLLLSVPISGLCGQKSVFHLLQTLHEDTHCISVKQSMSHETILGQIFSQ